MTMYVSYVYKRRRLRNSIALLPAEVSKNFYDICGSSISIVDSDCHSTVMANDEVKLDIDSFNPADEVSSMKSPVIYEKDPTSLLPVSEIPVVFSGKQLNGRRDTECVSESDEIPFIEVGSARKASDIVDLNLISEHGSSASNDCSSQNSHMEQFAISTGSEYENVTECSSIVASIEVVEPPHDSSATSGPCINSAHLVGDAYPISVALPPKNLNGNMTGCHLACQKCNLMGNSSSMLICDHCEKACHLHCCSEKILLREDWYCELCSRNGPRSLLDGSSETYLSVNRQCQRRTLRLELGPILFMLNDAEPYTSKVRIGQSFQAEVPEWPIIPSQSEDPFGEPSVLDMEQLPVLRVGDINSYMLHTTGNWVQCREKNACGAICGKWRRAPLFVRQTDNWDCSCAVLWDPYHADCSVPQELGDEEILKQLKYVDLLRSRFPKVGISLNQQLRSC